MCVILDLNILPDVFNPKPSRESSKAEAGSHLFDWLNTGRVRLVVGGKVRSELASNEQARHWMQEAIQSGRARAVNDRKVNERMTKLQTQGLCKSNDEHVIALAQISRANLLCTQDKNLMDDFRNKELIDKPRGRIYQTRNKGGKLQKFGNTHRKLLNSTVCNP